jgi:hypothetical protein
MPTTDSQARIGQGPSRPVTVTLAEGTLAAARAVAGPRGTSALVERALERELRRLALTRFVEDYELEHGMITPEEVAEQDAVLAAARAAAQR